MRIIRQKIKAFSQPPLQNNNPEQTNALGTSDLTSKDLLLEQMKQQRQLMATQRLRQKIQAQERRDQLRIAQQVVNRENKEDQQDAKNNIQVKKLEQQANDSGAKNVGLYKTRSRVTQPVPMKN